jgi:cardiolipin synthase A/B
MDTLILLLLIAALLYMIGAYLWRDTPLRRVRVRGPDRLDAAGAPVRHAFEVLAGCAVKPGHRIDLLENGDALFPRLLEDLHGAERLITWQVFWFKPGNLAQQIGEALAERARAGVEVLVLLDYFGAKGLGDEYVRDLRDSGVQVQIYRGLHWKTLYKVPHRSHVRSVVIDGRIGYTGGFGIDDRWLGDGRRAGHWRDTHVRIEGPAVDQLQAPFIANWAECTGELLLGDGIMEAAEARGDGQAAAVMYGSPSLGSTSAERFLALTIAAARESLFVTSAYFVPAKGFRGLLCEAVARGVDVRVLTPGARTDQRFAWYAARAYYEELLAAGVRIYEYEPTMVHAKTIVADGVWASIGSVNFDNRSLKLNDEVTLVAQDPTLGRAMQEMFMRDLEHAQELRLEEFRKRPRHARAREQAALLAAPLL